MLSKFLEYLRHPSFFLLWLDHRRFITLDDAVFLKLSYLRKFGRPLDLENPETFNEKLQWLKLHDRNANYTMMVDKDKVKSYVGEKIGKEYIIPTLGVYDEFRDIDIGSLPDKFIMKCTHDSGSTVICHDKSQFDFRKARRFLNKRLRKNFYYFGREWPYKDVRPAIIIERYMEDDKNEDLLDYKFLCFNGKVKCSFVCSDRRSEAGLAVDFYDLAWKHMPFTRHYRNSGILINKPKHYDKMIELAEILSEGIPFVRVDFYEIRGRIYFGEMTFFPGNGMEEFEPECYDKVLGDMLDISNEV